MPPSHLTRRDFLRLRTMGLGAVALAACARSPASPATASQPLSDYFRPTDPTTVKLAAGLPQLVEFFAYW